MLELLEKINRGKMKFLKFFWIIVTLLALVGCAAKGPAYNAYTKNDAATIDGTFANFFKIVFGADANILITSIDSKSAAGSLDSIKVSPGEHMVSVSGNTANNGAGGIIKVILKANHNYKLRAKASEKFFTVYLFDITNNEEGILNQKYKIKARGYNLY